MTDLFNEKYVHISGGALGTDDIQIFAKKRGNYIFRVSIIPATFREDEGNVYEIPYLRYMIIETEKDKDGYLVVKDYIFFDISLPDEKMLQTMKDKFIQEVEDVMIDMFMNHDNGENVNRNGNNESKLSDEHDRSYF